MGLRYARSNFERGEKRSLAAGRVPLFLKEVDELETGVEEAVDAVGETRLFCARETGRGSASHAPGRIFVNHGGEEQNVEVAKHALVPTHASHLVD